MALANPARPWHLADLLAGFAVVPAGANLGVGNIVLDSSLLVLPGALFLACSGGAAHGMAFAEQARRRGAVAIAAEPTAEWDIPTLAKTAARLGLPIIPVPGLGSLASALADRFYGEPSARLDIFGIAGTKGKTSVCHFLAQTLAVQTRFAVVGAIGVGFPGDLTSSAPPWSNASTRAAPDAVDLQDTLARLHARGAQAVAMAVFPHTAAAAVRFSHAVSTYLGGDNTSGAERTLFSAPGLRWAVLNADDPASTGILADLGLGAAVALYGLRPKPPAGWRHDLWVGLSDLTPLRRGLRLRIRTDGYAGTDEGEVEVGVLGIFNAANLLAVLAILLSRGLALGPALQSLARVQGVPGRLERFGGEGAPLVAVDCARTPDALEQATANLRRHGGDRLITVVGCGGERDRAQRPRLGAAAEAGSDQVIVTDDNPRGEDGDAIVAEVLSGMRHPERVRVERRRGLAVRVALTLAGCRDSVLVAGKGHETTQDLGGLKRRYSDRAQVVQALREWKGRDQATVCDWTEGLR
jgi:UDP-N-acetylmuramoyl-L-alanyl-D-glutamate--2,6-diaminopimelate ligase